MGVEDPCNDITSLTLGMQWGKVVKDSVGKVMCFQKFVSMQRLSLLVEINRRRSTVLTPVSRMFSIFWSAKIYICVDKPTNINNGPFLLRITI